MYFKSLQINVTNSKVDIAPIDIPSGVRDACVFVFLDVDFRNTKVILLRYVMHEVKKILPLYKSIWSNIITTNTRSMAGHVHLSNRTNLAEHTRVCQEWPLDVLTMVWLQNHSCLYCSWLLAQKYTQSINATFISIYVLLQYIYTFVHSPTE